MILYVLLEYDIGNDTVKIIDTNMRSESIIEVIDDFLRTQVGAGEDERYHDEREYYDIKISLDLETDTFECAHNCGNKGLRDGILMRCEQLMKSGKV